MLSDVWSFWVEPNISHMFFLLFRTASSGKQTKYKKNAQRVVSHELSTIFGLTEEQLLS